MPTAIENTQMENNVQGGEKFFRDGQLLIRKDGKTYNVIGQQVAQ